MKVIHRYTELLPGTLIRRYKRFLADVALESGETVTAFCPNTGSMKGLVAPGTPAMLSRSLNPSRRTAYTLEMLRPGRAWVGVNTILTNALAARLIEAGLLGGPLSGMVIAGREVRKGSSRLDFLLSDGAGRYYMEVKSVTLREGAEARFPDAETTRGRRHIEELASLMKEGDRACLLYIVQRADCRCFASADHIDPRYALAHDEAKRQGLAVMAASVRVSPRGIEFLGMLPPCGG